MFVRSKLKPEAVEAITHSIHTLTTFNEIAPNWIEATKIKTVSPNLPEAADLIKVLRV